MNFLKQIFLSVFTVTLFCSLTPLLSVQDSSDNPTQQPGIDAFFDKLFLSEVSQDPQKLSSIGFFESQGIYDHNAYLTDISPQAKISNLEEKKKNLQLLKKYSFEDLSWEQKTSYKVFLWYLNTVVDGEKFLFHEYYMNHLEESVLSDLTMVFTQFHQLKTREHINLYITRLSHISEQIEQSITLLEHQKKLGIVTPAFSLSHSINIIKKLTPKSVTKNIFYSHLAMAIEKIDRPNKKEILIKTANIIKTSVYPAFQKLQQYLKTLLSQTNNNNGVWALPNGDEYYAYKLRYHTSTNLSADQIHKIGIQEVQKIQTEMRKVFEKEHLNNNKKSVAQLMEKLFKWSFIFYPRHHYFPTKNGRKKCLSDCEAIVERSQKKLLPLFNFKPKALVKIQAVPKCEEEDGPMTPYYCPPSLDGSRPGVVFINLGKSWIMPKFVLENNLIHEAIPGHHLQFSLQYESNMPILRRLGVFEGFMSYFEGWALYAEKLAYEQGFYSSNFTKLGHLGADLLRAARLVADTGIHKKKWTKEKAIEYMKTTTGLPKALIVSEVEKYFVDPGQVCSYTIGKLKILELRQRAKDTLGEKFDIREFHNAVLSLGGSPLSLLEEEVNQYIQNKLNA